MKIKNYFISFFANIDEKLAKYENHAAISQATIENIKAARVKARVRYTKLCRERISLEQKNSELTQTIELWKKRAKDCKENDEEKALVCLRHKRIAEENLAVCKKLWTNHEQAIARLSQELEKADFRIKELEAKRSIFVSREVLSKIGSNGETLQISDSEKVFERWEEELLTAEATAETETFGAEANSLQAEFESQEERESLLAELKDL